MLTILFMNYIHNIITKYVVYSQQAGSILIILKPILNASKHEYKGL